MKIDPWLDAYLDLDPPPQTKVLLVDGSYAWWPSGDPAPPPIQWPTMSSLWPWDGWWRL